MNTVAQDVMIQYGSIANYFIQRQHLNFLDKVKDDYESRVGSASFFRFVCMFLSYLTTHSRLRALNGTGGVSNCERCKVKHYLPF